MGLSEQATASNLYHIEEILASGGMGTVYRAVDVQLKRPVALKVLRDSDDPDLLERFLREQEITGELDHPNFVKVLSIGYLKSESATRPFYTMPLLKGLTLEQLVTRRGQRDAEGERLRAEFTLPRLLQIMQQVCLTLQSAHDKRIIHRDIKPQNVILGSYGEIYVTDLGLAKRLAPKAKETGRFSIYVMQQLAKTLELGLTGDHILGTPYYMAPEQVLAPRQVDARADIFGLGALLYFVLTGLRPQYLEPVVDPAALEERKAVLVRQLAPHAGGRGITKLLFARLEDVPEAVRPLVEEYGEVEGLLHDDPGSKLRLTMRDCRIIPPRELLARSRLLDDGIPQDPVDPALEAVCMTALARDPAARYPSCRHMGTEIQQYLEKRHELILKRKGRELARDASPAGAEGALQCYEEAELRLREGLAEHEKEGRLGIEERLELFDILLSKARIHDRSGNRETAARILSDAEPLMDATLAELQRKTVEVLISKGRAHQQKESLAEAKALLHRATQLADALGDPDLRFEAAYRFGLALVESYRRNRGADDFDRGEDALHVAVQIAGELGDPNGGVRARIALARLFQEHPGAVRAAGPLLEEALAHAGTDRVSLTAAHLALAVHCLRSEDYPAAVRHGEESARRALDVGLEASLQDALFALGRAYHFAGDGSRRASTFRGLLADHGRRNPALVSELNRFYEEQKLDVAEILAGSGQEVRG